MAVTVPLWQSGDTGVSISPLRALCGGIELSGAIAGRSGPAVRSRFDARSTRASQSVRCVRNVHFAHPTATGSTLCLLLLMGVSLLTPILALADSGTNEDVPFAEKSFQERFGTFPARVQLELAAREGNLAGARRALADGAGIGAEQAGFPVMRRAIQGSNPDIVRLFLSRGADPNGTFQVGDAQVASLYYALKYYDICVKRCDAGYRQRMTEIVNTLLDFGARFPNGVAMQGRDHPLVLAASHCDLDLVRRFLRSNMDMTQPGTAGPPILLGCGDPKLTRLLLDHGAEITPAFAKAVLDDIHAEWKATIANWLLDAGIDPIDYDFVGMALAWNDYELLRSSLERGASPDRFVGMKVNFPLGLSAGNGNRQAVSILLEYGADPETTWHNKTAAELARQTGHVEVARLIEQYTSRSTNK